MGRFRTWLSFRMCTGVALTVIALSYGGQAIYLTAKAELAQILLLRAWQQGQLSKQATVPWPWADTQPVALLNVPALSLQQVVLDSHSGEALAFGPGLVSVGNSHVLAGHRDSHFEYLRNLEVGDALTLRHLSGSVARYRITEIFVLDVRESIDYVPPEESLTLITCYPFDALAAGGPLRYVIQGTLTI